MKTFENFFTHIKEVGIHKKKSKSIINTIVNVNKEDIHFEKVYTPTESDVTYIFKIYDVLYKFRFDEMGGDILCDFYMNDIDFFLYDSDSKKMANYLKEIRPPDMDIKKEKMRKEFNL